MKYLVLLVFVFSVTAFAQNEGLKNRNISPARDSVKKKVVVDTVRFQQQLPFARTNPYISDSSYLWQDYRYAADFFSTSGLGFTRSLGTICQPEELTLYGFGNRMISVFQDGDLLNDRSSKGFVFAQLQGEGVEKIEMPALPRGFLYGPWNNPVSVQALSISGISAVPYTRIRYFQAPFLEAYFDFRQQQIFFKKLFAALEVSNYKKDEGYSASASSMWQASLQLLYPVTRQISIGSNYRFTRFAPGLFGGVAMDSVKGKYSNPDNVLYDEILAPVSTPNHYYTMYRNALSVTARYKASELLYNEASVYGQESVTQFRLNAADTVGSPGRISFNQIVKTAGFRLRHDVQLDWFKLSLHEGYENSTGKDSMYSGIPDYSRWFVSGNATFSAGSQLQASVFAKISGNKQQTMPGLGGDIQLYINPQVSAYAGVSTFQRERSLQENKKTTYLVGEARMAYSGKDEQLSLTAYGYSSTDAVGGMQILKLSGNTLVRTVVPSVRVQAVGGAIQARKQLGVFLIEGAFSGFSAKEQSGSNAEIPLFSGKVGVYYKNVHFDSSLMVKTGFVTNFFSSFTPLAYDIFYNTTYRDNAIESVPANADVSFYMAGEVKKRAIVYFTWENLLDRKYYLTAYYPMPRRGLRFGIAWQLFN